LPGLARRYQTLYRRVDLPAARRLLAEAGYPDGVDAGGRRLRLSFDTSATTASANLQFEFLARSWRQLGIDVDINATTYNQFQDKVRRGPSHLSTSGLLS